MTIDQIDKKEKGLNDLRLFATDNSFTDEEVYSALMGITIHSMDDVMEMISVLKAHRPEVYNRFEKGCQKDE